MGADYLYKKILADGRFRAYSRNLNEAHQPGALFLMTSGREHGSGVIEINDVYLTLPTEEAAIAWVDALGIDNPRVWHVRP